jgi:hypothetical protein
MHENRFPCGGQIIWLQPNPWELVRRVRTFRNIARILSSEEPTTIAKEAVWRLKKRRDLFRFEKVIQQQSPTLTLRTIPYYRPNCSEVDPQEREAIIHLADEVVNGSFPLLSYGNVRLGQLPNWHVDFIANQEWPIAPIEQLPTVRFDGSDIKVPWELSRLQFLPILGKANLLTSRNIYRDRAMQLVENWITCNPVGRGINWMVSMEVALRALSILFLINLLQPFASSEQQWLEKVNRSLWQHQIFIETHLEFSHIVRGNHYLANLIGLYGLGVFLAGKGMESCRTRNRRLLEREVHYHVYEDGGNYEASTGYHVLVLQIFLSAFLLMRAEGYVPSTQFERKLKLMFDWATTLSDKEGRLPHLGDCDDGRVELLSDDLFQMSSLPLNARDSLRVKGLLGLGAELFSLQQFRTTTDKSWYGLDCSKATPRSPDDAQQGKATCNILPNSGAAIMRWGSNDVLLAAFPNGIHGKGTHTHNDKLSVLLRLDGRELLCDPGTGGYTRDLKMRNRFRSTRAHNCVIVDGKEQNTVPTRGQAFFSLGDEARVGTISWRDSPGAGTMEVLHRGSQLKESVHTRRVVWERPQCLSIVDSFTGAGLHTVELCFNLGPGWQLERFTTKGRSAECVVGGFRQVRIVIQCSGEIRICEEPSEISWTYGTTIRSSRIVASTQIIFPEAVQTEISWND